MAKVALCVIATTRYTEFVQPLLTSADRFFLKGHNVTYHIFTDGITTVTDRPCILHHVDHQPWPMMTLKRYHIMQAVNFSGYDYMYYIDADMLFVAPVGEEIFAPIMAVHHPGYYRGGGDWENNPNSMAYLPSPLRQHYYCGGFQGGSQYHRACVLLAANIDADERMKIRARNNDESHWNRYVVFALNKKTLPPSYCMVEEIHKRKAWGIADIEPKVLALAKNHNLYQR